MTNSSANVTSSGGIPDAPAGKTVLHPKQTLRLEPHSTTVLLSTTKEFSWQIATSMQTHCDNLAILLLGATSVFARSDHPINARISELRAEGIIFAVERDACRRRGITQDRLNPDVLMISTANIADVLLDSTTKAVWL